MCRKRIRVAWTPVWEGSIKSWATQFLWKNKWRCDYIFDFDDLLQDAYLVFVKINDTYPRVIEPKHFMALFKRAMYNMLHDHSRGTKRKRKVFVDSGFDATQFYADRIIGEPTNAGYASLLVAEAPEELHMALKLVQDPEVPKAMWGEGTDKWVRRSLGFDRKFLDCHRKFAFSKALKMHLAA